MPPVRVRFAPSPTGFLHVGGARTAIFNWLFARRRAGSFVLRVEDTDLGRSSEPMVRAILEGLDWLGLKADEGPFFQSRSRARHVEVARRLLAHGQAYRCFCNAAALKQARERAAKERGSYSYARTCRDLDPEDAAGRAEAGEPCAVRFRVPEREVAWEDRVHGRTVFEHGALEDFVLLRSDGTPTYQLSVVADDLDMQITHVIRGDDHLSNTPKQLLIYRALGETTPEFAHLPLILGDDRKRLSKRHGAVSVLEYRDRGYLPDAMFNFLALLGWSPGDDRQLLDRAELIEAFDLTGVGRAGAIFDLQKLEWMSGQYMMATPPERLVELARPFLGRAGLWRREFEIDERSWLLRLLDLLRPRVRTLEGFVTQGRPYLEVGDEIDYDAKAAKKHLKGEALLDNLRELERRLVALQRWEPQALEQALRTLADERELSAAKLIHPIRLAVTGRGASPGIFEVLDLVGRERSLRRLRRLIAHVERGDVP